MISKKDLLKKMLRSKKVKKENEKHEKQKVQSKADYIDSFFDSDDYQNDKNSSTKNDNSENDIEKDIENDIKKPNKNDSNSFFNNDTNSFFDNNNSLFEENNHLIDEALSNNSIDNAFSVGNVKVEGNINKTKQEVKMSNKQKKFAHIIGILILPTILFFFGSFVILFTGIEYLHNLETTAIVSLASPKYYAELGSEGLLGGQRQQTDIPDDLIGCEPDLNIEYGFNDKKKSQNSDEKGGFDGSESSGGKLYKGLDKLYKEGKYKEFIYKLAKTASYYSGIPPAYCFSQWSQEQGQLINQFLSNSGGNPSSHPIQDKNLGGITYPCPDSSQGQPRFEGGTYARFDTWDKFAKNYGQLFKGHSNFKKAPSFFKEKENNDISPSGVKKYIIAVLLNGNTPTSSKYFTGVDNQYNHGSFCVSDKDINTYRNGMMAGFKNWQKLESWAKGKGYGSTPVEASTFYDENLNKFTYENDFLKEYNINYNNKGYGTNGNDTSNLPKWRKVLLDHAANDFKNAKYTQSSNRLGHYGQYADCSSFVYQVYQKALGIKLESGSTTYTEIKDFRIVDDLSAIKPGDVIFYGPKSCPSHIAIYGGGGIKKGFQYEMKDENYNFQKWDLDKQWNMAEKPTCFGTIVGTKYYDELKKKFNDNDDSSSNDSSSDNSSDNNQSNNNQQDNNQSSNDESSTYYLTYSGYRTTRMHYTLNGQTMALDDALIDSSLDKKNKDEDEKDGKDSNKYDSKYDKELTKDPKYPYNPTKEEKWIIAKESGYRDGDTNKVGNPHAKNQNSDAYGIGQLMLYNYDAAFKGIKGYNGFGWYKNDAGKQLYAMRYYLKTRYGSVNKGIEFWKIHHYY